MQISTAGLMALIAHEGIVLSRYRDSKGIWTIGVGHTKAAGNPDPATFKGTMTFAEAMGLLRHDIISYEAAVNKAIKVPLAQHEFDALVSFHYNTGAIARASLTKSINAGNKPKAAQQFMSWVKPPEITERRQAERDLFRSGKYPKPMATIYPATASGAVQWGKGKRVDIEAALAASRAPVAPEKQAPNSSDAPKTDLAVDNQDDGTRFKLIVSLVVGALAGAGTWLAMRPCEWLGVFCQ